MVYKMIRTLTSGNFDKEREIVNIVKMSRSSKLLVKKKNRDEYHLVLSFKSSSRETDRVKLRS